MRNASTEVLERPEHLHVIDALGEWAEQIIAAELERLVRRTPTLTDIELQLLRQELRHLVDVNLLDPVRLDPDLAPRVRDLFDLHARWDAAGRR